MMKYILFIFLRHSENPNDSTLTKDLSDEFFKQGNNVTVVTILEKKYKRETQLKIENGYEVLRVKTGNYFNVSNSVEKGITSLTMISKLKREIINYLGKKRYDLIITHTPFISTEKLINPLKSYFKCPAHLILWDIFPQNAKDIGILKNKLLFSYFKYNERKMFLAYECIWCMSEGNVNYLRENYSYLDKEKIKLLRNWALIKPKLEINKEEIMAIGDNMNDKRMVENAGLGVMMENCASYMKEFADVIVKDNNNDGVAEAIEKYVLSEE